MDKYKIKEQLRKVRWATEHQTGKRLGKKGLIEVQKIVMEMNKKTDEPVKPETTNWKGADKSEPQKLSVDLSSLIGKKF